MQRRATWMVGPLATWRWRADAPVDLPEGVAEAHALQHAGRHVEAARWWSARGCRYAAALALLDAGDDASAGRAHTMLVELGADAVAERVMTASQR